MSIFFFYLKYSFQQTIDIMKLNYKTFLMTFISILIMGTYSCGGGDDIPEPEPTPKPDQDKVTISPTNITAETEGGTLSLSMTANKAWTAASNQTWCTLSKTTGQAGSETITINVAANPNETERTATITVKAGTASATATVKQAKKESQQGGGDSGEIGANGGSIEDMENKKW